MTTETAAANTLAADIINRIEALLLETEREGKPLELDPHRGRLFELFVLADGSGCIDEDADPDLTVDGIAKVLGERWNLADAAQRSMADQSRLPQAHLAKMRLLWSFMRMWMEWTYAWGRWAEFHGA
jgi:hypothetical protein